MYSYVAMTIVCPSVHFEFCRVALIIFRMFGEVYVHAYKQAGMKCSN